VRLSPKQTITGRESVPASEFRAEAEDDGGSTVAAGWAFRAGAAGAPRSGADVVLPAALHPVANATSPAKMRTKSSRSPYLLVTALILQRGPPLLPNAGSTNSDTASTPIIVVEGLRKSLRTGSTTVDILRGLDFTIARGEFVAIMGASGSGKSTLLGLLAGLDNPSSGNVRWQGTAISYLPENELAQLRGRTIGFVFQSYQLIPTLTALENVLLPYELNADGSRREGLERAGKLLDSVGLSERLEHYPVQLSGGEQQRVALARAFMLRPPIVLADEPTGNLDSTNGQHVLDLLLELNRAEGTTLVLVTHDPALAAHASRRIILRDGEIVAEERTAVVSEV
jgi:putative ABC transport system ATP-binding protein